MISYNNLNNNINIPERRSECITIGRFAPDFIALSTQGYIRLSDYRGQWVIISSQPMAFTPVSTTEVVNISQLYPELVKRNTSLIGLTTDNVYSNLAWIYDIYQKTGVTVPFPIISDADLKISELYGMLNPDRLYEESVRDVFIINPYGRIRAILTLPTSCGISAEEIIRVLDSLQITERYNLYTPAGWHQGEPLLVPAPTTYDELINRVNAGENPGMQCYSWYLCYTGFPEQDNVDTPATSSGSN